MSHDCRVTGTLSIKHGVTENQIKNALKNFLREHSLDFDEEQAEGNIEIEGRALFLSLDIQGDGGYRNESLDALSDSLDEIVDIYGYLEFLDFDTGSSDAACTPYFIGADEAARTSARVMYGISQMEPWILPVIGVDAFETITKEILSQPLAGQ